MNDANDVNFIVALGAGVLRDPYPFLLTLPSIPRDDAFPTFVIVTKRAAAAEIDAAINCSARLGGFLRAVVVNVAWRT